MGKQLVQVAIDYDGATSVGSEFALSIVRLS
jgi:hypothetical protein